MDTNTNNNSAPTSAEATAKKLKKQRIRQYIVSAIGVAILVWGIFEIACLFLDYKNTETSNDAQIEQYISPVNMRATGYIKKIYFKEHQDVKKGDTLLVLDDREYRIRVMEAEAALEMARLNLSYCVVLAPCDGKLGRRALEEGQAVNAGQSITYIMPDTEKWVIANYKETQVENLHVGQKVKMTVDAINGKVFSGKITAISGATGSKYSLVPTDNSAGNFVKIQQRVPVRIEFEGLSKEDNDRLAAGMMVVVKAQL